MNKMLHVQLIASLIRDFTCLHEGAESIDVRSFVAFVRARQHAECPSWFHRCKDRSADVERCEWLHERFLPPDFRVTRVSEVLDCTHVLERHAPPIDCVTMVQTRIVYDDGGYTYDAYRRRPSAFDAFHVSSLTCMALAELVEYRGAGVTVRLSSGMMVEKGLDVDCVRVVKPFAPPAMVVGDRSSVPTYVSAEEYGGGVSDLNVLECRWNLSREHRIETYLFVQETIDTLAVPFKLERDAETDTFWVRVFMLELTVLLDEAGEFRDRVLVNPLFLFLKTDLLMWKSMLASKLPNVQILRSYSYVNSSEAQTATVPLMEMNIRDSWHVSELQHFPERPRASTIASNLASGVVWCMDMPEYPDGITDSKEIRMSPPPLPFFTREALLNLVRSTCHRHFAHILSRGDRYVSTAGTVHGCVTCTTSAGNNISLVYVSVCYRVGVNYRIGHVVMVTHDVPRARAFMQRHMLPDPDCPWIQEDVFVALATRATRLCTSVHLLLPPIPVGRVMFPDEYTTISIQKGTWKLAGCGCPCCMSVRAEPMVRN